MTFISSKISCRACLGERKESDTVKIDFDRLAATKKPSAKDDSNKENNAPTREQRLQKEEQWKSECAEERRRKETEDRAEKERQRIEEERKSREEAGERERNVAAEEHARMAEEQRRFELERQRKEAEAAAAAAARQKEQEDAAAARKAEEDQRQRELRNVLSAAGYEDVNEKKVTKGMITSSFSYPLHAAVEAADENAVRILLWGVADREVVNSKKRTPLALARKKNKKGSHDKIIALLA